MNTKRTELEKRIIKILQYINFQEIEKFTKSLSLYKDEELQQIESYLETGNLEGIYNFLLGVKKEVLEIHEEKRQLHNRTKLEKLKEKEKQEHEEELININF